MHVACDHGLTRTETRPAWSGTRGGGCGLRNHPRFMHLALSRQRPAFLFRVFLPWIQRVKRSSRGRSFFFLFFFFFFFFFTRNGPPNVLMGGSNVVSRLINNSRREISRLLTLLLLLGHGFTILICYFVTKNCWGQGNNFENAISKFRLRRGWWWLLFTRKVCRC